LARRIYHVLPAPGGGWLVREQKQTEPLSRHRTKPEAVAAAREVAQANRPAQVVVHLQNGKISEEFTYGHDPYPPAG